MGRTASKIAILLLLVHASAFSLEKSGPGYQLRMNVEKSLLLNNSYAFAEQYEYMPGFSRSESFRLAFEGKLENNIDLYGKIEQNSSVDDPLLVNFVGKKDGWSLEAGRFISRQNQNGAWLAGRTIDGGELIYKDSVWEAAFTGSGKKTELISKLINVDIREEVILDNIPVLEKTFRAELDGRILVAGRDYVLDSRRGIVRFTSRFRSDRSLAGLSDRVRFRIAYETAAANGAFQASRLQYKPHKSFVLSTAAYNSSQQRGVDGAIMFNKDSVIRLNGEGLIQFDEKQKKKKKLFVSNIMLAPAESFRFDGELNLSDTGIALKSMNSTESENLLIKTSIDLSPGTYLKLRGEYEKTSEFADSIITEREYAAVKIKSQSEKRLQADLLGSFDRTDTSYSYHSNASASLRTARADFTVGAEMEGSNSDSILNMPYYLKVSSSGWNNLSASLKFAADGLDKFSASGFADANGKHGNISFSGEAEIDSSNKLYVNLDGQSSLNAGKAVKTDLTARGEFECDKWKSLLFRGDLRLFQGSKWSMSYSPLYHVKSATLSDSTQFNDVRHEAILKTTYLKFSNALEASLSKRDVYAVVSQIVEESNIQDRLNTSINRNIALSLDGEYNSDRISQLSETNRTMLNNKTGAGISLRFLGKVLGELSLSGGFVLTERKPTVDSISFLDSSALFKPDVDTLNSEYYYTKRVSREGGLSYKKGSETLDASIQVRTNWDSDYLSPTGIVFPSKESFGVNPEISVDYRLNTLFNCSAKMGGETQNGYRRYQKLYSSFDFSVAAKYVRLSTSLFWEKEKRELGEINNLEWKIDLLLTI